MEFKYNKISFFVCVCVFFRFVFLSHFSRFHHRDRVVKLTCKQIKYNKNSVAGNELVSVRALWRFICFVCLLVGFLLLAWRVTFFVI